jgi:hypothetical protein
MAAVGSKAGGYSGYVRGLLPGCVDVDIGDKVCLAVSMRLWEM